MASSWNSNSSTVEHVRPQHDRHNFVQQIYHTTFVSSSFHCRQKKKIARTWKMFVFQFHLTFGKDCVSLKLRNLKLRKPLSVSVPLQDLHYSVKQDTTLEVTCWIVRDPCRCTVKRTGWTMHQLISRPSYFSWTYFFHFFFPPDLPLDSLTMHHSTPPLHSLLSFYLDTLLSPTSSLIVFVPPPRPTRPAPIGSFAEHCPFFLFLYLNMSSPWALNKKKKNTRMQYASKFQSQCKASRPWKQYICFHHPGNRNCWITFHAVEHFAK